MSERCARPGCGCDRGSIIHGGYEPGGWGGPEHHAFVPPPASAEPPCVQASPETRAWVAATTTKWPVPASAEDVADEECYGSCERTLSAARVAAGHTLCVACQSLWDRAAAAGRLAGAKEMQREAYADVCSLRCTAHGNADDGCPCLAAAEQTIAKLVPR